MWKIASAAGLLLSMVVASSCGQEISYMAKFCGPTETSFYVMKDLSTLTLLEAPYGVSIDGPNGEKGVILKKDRGQFIEYSGALDFIALKDVSSPMKIEGHPVEIREDYYIVDSTSRYGNRVSFFINFEGALFRFDEHIIPASGKKFSIRSDICGGEFIVN